MFPHLSHISFVLLNMVLSPIHRRLDSNGNPRFAVPSLYTYLGFFLFLVLDKTLFVTSSILMVVPIHCTPTTDGNTYVLYTDTCGSTHVPSTDTYGITRVSLSLSETESRGKTKVKGCLRP